MFEIVDYNKLAAVGKAINKIGEVVVDDRIKAATDAYMANMTRVEHLIAMVPNMISLSIRFQKYNSLADIEIFKGEPSETQREDQKLMALRGAAISRMFDEDTERIRENPNEFKRKEATAGVAVLHGMINLFPQLASGMNAVLSSTITGTWTAFEVLAGDLWEASLNGTSAFAGLHGDRKRIADLCEVSQGDDAIAAETSEGEAEGKESASDKWLSLQEAERITKGSYDLRALMGTVHRASGNVKFSTLTGIREAYSRAFDPGPRTVDAALSNKSLDSLHLVRNLIVHRAGIADRTYVKRAEAIPGMPNLEERQELKLSGEAVSQLVAPVIDSCVSLLKGVNAFIVVQNARTA